MRIFIFVLLILLVLLVLNTRNLKEYFKNINNETLINKNSSQYGEKKKIIVKCLLKNEIIDRSRVDSERQCFYECREDDIERVDTSISFPCQEFIREERLY